MCYDEITPARWEQETTRDLNVTGYARKWRKAKEIADREIGNTSSHRHWRVARQRFLELGGEYKGQTGRATP